jgi:hypothetical protein
MNTAAGSHKEAQTALHDCIQRELEQQGKENQITATQKELLVRTIQEDQIGFGDRLLHSYMACHDYIEYALSDEEGTLPDKLGKIVWMANYRYLCKLEI